MEKCSLQVNRKLYTFVTISHISGMLQDTSNDTILKQLHQPVGVSTLDSIQADSLRVIIPESMFVPPLRASDTINRDFFPVLQKQSSLRHLVSKGETESAPVPPVPPEQVVLFTEEPYKARIILPERKIERDSPDWQVAVFIVALILLGSVRLFFNKYLGQLLLSVVNYSAALRMFRERSLSLLHASFRLDLLFYLVLSLFMFHTFRVFHVSLHPSELISYFLLFGGIWICFGMKKLAYYIQGTISRSSQETAEFLFNMNICNRVTGLFLLPVCLVVAFSPLSKPELVIFAGFCIISVFYLLLILRGVKILMRKQFSIFYLILYLCTLEILPLLFISKLALG